MLELINIFEVVLVQSVAYEFTTQESKLITSDREQAIAFATNLYDDMDIDDFEYIDNIVIEVRGGVLGQTGLDTVIAIQRVALHHERDEKEQELYDKLNAEVAHDEMMESIMRDAEKTRKVISGLARIPISMDSH